MLIKAGWNFDADGRKGSIFGMPAGVSLMPPLAAGEALAIELNNISVAAMTVADLYRRLWEPFSAIESV